MAANHSLDEPYTMRGAQRQHNAHPAASVLAEIVSHQQSGLKLDTTQSTSPQQLQFQLQQQATDARPVQRNDFGTSSTSKQSKGGRGAPPTQLGKGRGRGRHRIAVD